MGAPRRDQVVATKKTFTAIDAARVALERDPPDPTPRRARVLDVAATLWCRQLHFPTVRAVGAAMGHRSPSTPLNGFGHVIDIQAGVIRREWNRIDGGWILAAPGERAGWLAQHVRDLLALDPACLRLPSLVTAAVVAADPGLRATTTAPLAPLHALAAYADQPWCHRGDPAAPGHLALTLAAAFDGGVELAVPA